MSDKKEMTQLDLQQKLERAEAEIQNQFNLKEQYLTYWREECKEASKTEEERDALQQQVNALAAENLSMQSASVSVINHYTESNKVGMSKAMANCIPELEVATMHTPATDAIKRQWMAEGLEKVAAGQRGLAEVRTRQFKSQAAKKAINIAELLEREAAQLRQP